MTPLVASDALSAPQRAFQGAEPPGTRNDTFARPYGPHRATPPPCAPAPIGSAVSASPRPLSAPHSPQNAAQAPEDAVGRARPSEALTDVFDRRTMTTQPDTARRHIHLVIDRSDFKAKASDISRFFVRVDATGICWEWQGLLSDAGYGRFTTSYRDVRKETGAHRWLWLLLVGPIPDDLVLDHLCRNRKCVNPDHLEPVTIGENIRRGWFPNRDKTHCPQGHPYSPENTKLVNGGRGRACRACAGFTGRGIGWVGAKTHCPQGHPYDEANTKIDPRTGHRRCRTCSRATVKAQQAKAKASNYTGVYGSDYLGSVAENALKKADLSHTQAALMADAELLAVRLVGPAVLQRIRSSVITDGTQSGLYAYSDDDRTAAGGHD